MFRSWLILVVVIGMVSSMVTTCASQRRPATSSAQSVSSDAAGFASGTIGSSGASSNGEVRLEREPNGHFYADVQINGSTVHALVDTGATGIALSREDARSAGVATSIGMPNVIGDGADGDVHGEVVMLDRVTLGDTTAEHMPAMVLDSGDMTLLGQEFLRKFDSVEIHGDTMVLR